MLFQLSLYIFPSNIHFLLHIFTNIAGKVFLLFLKYALQVFL